MDGVHVRVRLCLSPHSILLARSRPSVSLSFRLSVSLYLCLAHLRTFGCSLSLYLARPFPHLEFIRFGDWLFER